MVYRKVPKLTFRGLAFVRASKGIVGCVRLAYHIMDQAFGGNMLTWNTGILKYPVLKVFIDSVVIWVPRLKGKFLVALLVRGFSCCKKIYVSLPHWRRTNCLLIVFVLCFFCLIIFPRVPEIVYQPSMLGIEQAGIAETIDFILNHFSADLQTALVQVRVE